MTKYRKFRRFMRRNYSILMISITIILSLISGGYVNFVAWKTAYSVERTEKELEKVLRQQDEIQKDLIQGQDYQQVIMSGLAEIKGYRQGLIQSSLDAMINNLPNKPDEIKNKENIKK